MATQIIDTKTYVLSTKSSNCKVLNNNINYKSLVQFDVPNFINTDDTVDFITYSVPYAVIPNSFYNFNEKNFLFIMKWNSQTTTYHFTYGNYTASSFMTAFKALVDPTFNISLNSVNSVFTITNTTYNFTLNGSSTIDYIIGFSGDTSSTSKTLVLPRCCNFMALPRINIRCKQLASGISVGSSASSDILLSVPNTGQPNGQIVYNPNSVSKSLAKVDILNTLVVSFTDDDDNLINFNGLSSFFVIELNIYRKYLDKPEAFNKIVEMVLANNTKKELDDENVI